MLDIGYTSIKSVIARLLLNPYIKEDFNEIMAIELFGECLRLIGTKELCMQDVATLTLKNYKAKLPKGTKRILGVILTPQKCKLERHCDVDNPLIEKCTITQEDEVCKDVCKPIVITKQMYDYNSVMPSFHLHPSTPQSIVLYPPESKFCIGNQGYTIRDSNIVTQHKVGELLISYLHYPLDEEGYPLIPDDAKVIECLINYYYYKIMQWRSYSMYDKDATILSREAEQRFIISMNQVHAKAKMPSIAQLERARKVLNNLLPSSNYFGNYG